MKILETIFFILMFAVPGFFAILALTNLNKVKKNKKFRKTLIKIIFLTAIINGVIWGALKMTNDNKETDNNTDSKYSENNNVPSDKKDNDDENQTAKPEEPIDNQKPEENKPSSNNPTSTDDKPASNNNSAPVTNGTTAKGYKIETIDGVTYIDGFMIANKTYPLPSTYVPTNTHKAVGNSHNCQECIIEDAYTAYTKMRSDMQALGMSIWIASGYRSYTYQNGLYTSYVNRSGKAAADTFSARPGHSEHQTGYAFDLNSVSDAFANTKEGKWVNENCYKYGFIIRYPKGKDNETGYKYESWHLRYVGENLASKLYNGGDWITMETYFGITSKYAS